MANAHDLLMAQRAAMMGGKSGYTAKDYVQDGLVAMWDGIENAGFAADGYQHDPNATVWKNLVSENDIVLANGKTWGIGDDYVFFDGANSESPLKNQIQIPHLSAEFVFEYVGGSVFCFQVYSDSIFAILNNSRGLQYSVSSNFYTLNPRPSFEGVKTSCSFVYSDPYYRGQVDVAYERSVPGSLTGSSSNWGSASVHILGVNCYGKYLASWKCHSIRLYNKQLSSSDVSTNYAIDKARFNLPDAA